jgi:hypothetical protein
VTDNRYMTEDTCDTCYQNAPAFIVRSYYAPADVLNGHFDNEWLTCAACLAPRTSGLARTEQLCIVSAL